MVKISRYFSGTYLKVKQSLSCGEILFRKWVSCIWNELRTFSSSSSNDDGVIRK